jgi:hemerythrin
MKFCQAILRIAAEEMAYFKKVIQQAVWYIKEHFSTEEKMMIATKFPGYLEHKKAHDEFTMTVVKSVKGYESGERLVLQKFASFLKNWVLTHIPIMDKQYAVYFEKVPIEKLIG